MKEILLQYGIFIIELATIIAVAAGAVMLLLKEKRENDNDEGIEIINITKEYKDEEEELKKAVDHSFLSKQELKAQAKIEKKEKKAKAKEEKANLKKLSKNGDLKENLENKTKETENKSRLFVIDFNGDVMAAQTEGLRKEIDAVIAVARPEIDEVLLKIESPGGVVHGYGLASSQLVRLKERNIKLTVVIDKVAASGGYLMSCVADKIISAPFAVVGSIGVVAEVINFHHLLKKNSIEAETYTAGEHKRTVTQFGENTPEAKEKFKEELRDIHSLFKSLVSKYRPQLDIEKVATGQAWYGTDALQLQLVDEIGISDDIILKAVKEQEVFAVKHHSKKKKNLLEKIGLQFEKSVEKVLNKVMFSSKREYL